MLRKIFTVTVVVLTIFWAVGLAAFVPTAQAATISSGDLIKAALPAVYYYGADGKRYVFPNEKTYKTWYPDFSGVKTITDGELATFQIGGNVTMRPGVKMGKITTDPKVYAIAANGTLRWVSTASLAASLYGSSWGSMIDDISDAFFVNYTIGAPINAVTDYSPSAATAGAQSINVDKGLAGATTTGGNLQISLASDTPASATVAAGASANMTKITLAAGSAAVQVNSLYVTRSGLSSNDDIQNIKLVGVDGATVGTVASLGSNSKALVTFVPSLQLAANTSLTLFIRASIGVAPAPGNAGNTVALSIAAASDVVLAAGTVTGAFPVAGNYMSIVVLANLGSATVGPNSLPPDSKPDAGSKRIQVSQFEVQAGPNENLTVESLSLMEAGSASNPDYANIELYSLTESRTLGTVAAWDANSRVVFGSMNIVIPKGSKHIFQVYTDVVSGSGNTLNVDVVDGTDALIVVKGNTYGFYLTPNAGGWNGKGADQTVNTGILNVTKDISSPATGNITQASEQALTTWAFEVRGESAKITSTKITLAGTIAAAAVINGKIVDETGTVVAGPKAITATWPLVTFTETYIVPTGTHKFTFKLDVLSSAINGSNVSASIVAPGTAVTGVGIDIQATGINTREDMFISSAAAAGNPQTVLGVALSVATLTQPAARLVSKGTQNFVWATASLDATNSGEDVRVSAVTVNDAHVGAGDFTEIQNLSIWADLTSASSDRGDAYETKVSNNEQPIVATATKAISLTQIITVPKGSFIKIAVIGSLSTLATGTSNKLSISAVTASGKSTGNGPTVVYTGAGQVMTNTGAGTLTMTIDASSPSAQILVSGQQKVTVGVLKLAGSNVENQDLDSVILNDAGTGVVSGNWYLYSSSRSDSGSTADPVAVAPSGANVNFQLADNTVTVPANGSVTLTVKADVAPVDGTTVVNLDTLQVQTYVTQTTGKSSGAIIIAAPLSGTITGNSIAAATVVTTGAAHGLANGDVVTITGSNSTPSIDGAFVVTVTGAATFTIPVTVTVAGTAGTWIGGTPLSAAIHTAMASRPTFSLNTSLSPTGVLVSSADTLLAVFNVTADSADDITWDGPVAPSVGTDTLDMQLSDGSGCVTFLSLKDDNGTLDTIGAAAGTNSFVFGTADFVVSKGTTKKLYVTGNTLGCVTNDVVQVGFSSADTQNWSINYDAGGYDLGSIIFRNNAPLANALKM